MYLFNTFCLVVVIHSAVCGFPSWVQKCPKSNPNAANCITNSAKIGFSHLVGGNPSLNLVSLAPFKTVNDVLCLSPNVEVILNGLTYPSNDSNVYNARIDMDNKFWEVDVRGSALSLQFNMTVSIREPFEVIQAKGQTTIIYGLDHFRLVFTGYYETHHIRNKNYMQLYYSHSDLTYDKYNQTYNLATMTGEPLTPMNLAKVQSHLEKFECELADRIEYFANLGFYSAFNTFFQMVPEDCLFEDDHDDTILDVLI